MRTLHFGLRVADLERSLAFCTSVGYEVVGRVPDTPLGELTMLKLVSDVTTPNAGSQPSQHRR